MLHTFDSLGEHYSRRNSVEIPKTKKIDSKNYLFFNKKNKLHNPHSSLSSDAELRLNPVAKLEPMIPDIKDENHRLVSIIQD